MVLYASRLNRFEQDFLVEPIKLAQLVQQAISENRRLFIGNRLRPEFQIPKNLFIYSDEKWLTFVLNQLITNAVRYSAGKGKKVAFYAEHQGDKAFLEVRDEGIGIPKQDLHRVFEPYFTGQRGREFRESTGMGLYLVRRIWINWGIRWNWSQKKASERRCAFFFANPLRILRQSKACIMHLEHPLFPSARPFCAFTQKGLSCICRPVFHPLLPYKNVRIASSESMATNPAPG